MKQRNATKIVSGAVVGLDCETALINGKVYIINPPTIAKMAGAGYYLSNLGEFSSIGEILQKMENFDAYAHALSWLITGDDSLADEFLNAPFGEVAEALGVAFSLMSPENFIKLSVLTKNVLRLIANPKL